VCVQLCVLPGRVLRPPDLDRGPRRRPREGLGGQASVGQGFVLQVQGVVELVAAAAAITVLWPRRRGHGGREEGQGRLAGHAPFAAVGVIVLGCYDGRIAIENRYMI
jgi:hypothetical protein